MNLIIGLCSTGTCSNIYVKQLLSIVKIQCNTLHVNVCVVRYWLFKLQLLSSRLLLRGHSVNLAKNFRNLMEVLFSRVRKKGPVLSNKYKWHPYKNGKSLWSNGTALMWWHGLVTCPVGGLVCYYLSACLNVGGHCQWVESWTVAYTNLSHSTG